MSEPFDTNRGDGDLRRTGIYDFDDQYKEAKYNDEIAGVLKTANHEAERKRRIAARRRKERKRRIITRLTIVIAAFLVVLILVITALVSAVRGIAGLFGNEEEKAEIAQLVQRADAAAATYDYDAAIGIIQSFGEKYDKKKELKNAVASYENSKSQLVKFADNTKISHISFRTLIYDTAKAFDGDSRADKYDSEMVTVTEFSNILNALYSRGYVLVGLNDIAGNQNGTFAFYDIYLPEGKTPIVLSQEDVSYDDSLQGNGFASKLVLDENGNPVCEYTDENGNVTTGAYDLVPILEDFIKQHPDFSYRGARATLAVTGYDGVLGYRTNPNGEGYREEDREQAKAVADRLKELGYTFASNSWGYTSYASSSTERVKTDADRWEAEVAPIVGNTNILIFAGGADIAQNGEYSADNAKFSYLQSKGFTVFCPADNSQYSTAIGERYLRQGRRVIGGNALYYEGDKLQDLFHAIDVLDIARPADNTVT